MKKTTGWKNRIWTPRFVKLGWVRWSSYHYLVGLEVQINQWALYENRSFADLNKNIHQVAIVRWVRTIITTLTILGKEIERERTGGSTTLKPVNAYMVTYITFNIQYWTSKRHDRSYTEMNCVKVHIECRQGSNTQMKRHELRRETYTDHNDHHDLATTPRDQNRIQGSDWAASSW